MDFAFMGAIGFTLVKTSMPWTTPAFDATLLAEIIAWLTGVAVLGTLLGQLRLRFAARDEPAHDGGATPRTTDRRGGIGARPLAAVGGALLLLMAPALVEWLVVVPRAHAQPAPVDAVVRSR